jgi:Leucine-rich repeat (LRR) protein
MGNYVSIQINEVKKRRTEELILNHVDMIKVPLEASKLNFLKKLNLAHNNLSAFTVKGLEQLEELILTANEFTEIPNELQNHPKLRVLDLAFNEIGHIGTELLQAKKLEALFLMSNPITHIVDEAFQELTSLKLLRFDNCFLEELPKSLFSCKNLERMDVRCNLIGHFPREIGMIFIFRKNSLNLFVSKLVWSP